MPYSTLQRIFNDVLDAANNLLKFRPVDSSGNNLDDGSGNLKTLETGGKATDATAVTPDDASNLTTTPTIGLYIGGAGNIKVNMQDGSTVTFNSVSAGLVYPFKVTRVYSTDTTATNIVALY